MSGIELIFYLALFIGITLISAEWAKYGLLELGIQGARNKRALIGFLFGIGASLLGSVAYKKGLFVPSLKFLLAIDSWPFLLILFIRRMMPPGQFEFNKARERILYWMRQYYSPGEILDIGRDLQSFPVAKRTVNLLEKAIRAQEAGKDMKNYLNTAIAYEELGFLFRMMNLWEEAQEALKRAIVILRDLEKRYPDDNNIKSALSLAIFRLAEIDHANGRIEKAIEGYNESLNIDRTIGDERSVAVMENMLNRTRGGIEKRGGIKKI